MLFIFNKLKIHTIKTYDVFGPFNYPKYSIENISIFIIDTNITQKTPNYGITIYENNFQTIIHDMLFSKSININIISQLIHNSMSIN